MMFQSFPSIPRLSKETCFITEKLDGTNSQLAINDQGDLFCGSRSRWITPEDDNFGFARWAMANKAELMKLGPGRHYGEWWGSGIQRGYGLKEKRFSLFNVSLPAEKLPACCSLVPLLYSGAFKEAEVLSAVESLRATGSKAAPGFAKPEGVVVYCVETKVGYKKLLEKDEYHKFQHANKAAPTPPPSEG